MRVIGWETRSRNEGEWCEGGGDDARNAGRPGTRYDPEHTCRDPKDGELCLSKMKPGETLVEV
jgi:hypothetical protein